MSKEETKEIEQEFASEFSDLTVEHDEEPQEEKDEEEDEILDQLDDIEETQVKHGKMLTKILEQLNALVYVLNPQAVPEPSPKKQNKKKK